MSNKANAIIQAIKDFPKDTRGATAQELIDWIESVCPFTEEQISGKVYEIWYGVDKASLMELKQFVDSEEAFDYAYEKAKVLYQTSTYPSQQELIDLADGDFELGYDSYQNHLARHTVVKVELINDQAYLESNGDLENYVKIAYSDIGNEDPQ